MKVGPLPPVTVEVVATHYQQGPHEGQQQSYLFVTNATENNIKKVHKKTNHELNCFFFLNEALKKKINK